MQPCALEVQNFFVKPVVAQHHDRPYLLVHKVTSDPRAGALATVKVFDPRAGVLAVLKVQRLNG